jgi:IS5 family transposase
LRNLMGIDLIRQSVPDSTTLMGFRHLLEANDLTKTMLVEVNAMLIERGLLMTKGTLVDARIIPRFSCLRLSPQRDGAPARPAILRLCLCGKPERTPQK